MRTIFQAFCFTHHMQHIKTWFLVASLMMATAAPLFLPAAQQVILAELLTEEEHSRKKVDKAETDKFFSEYRVARLGNVLHSNSRYFHHSITFVPQIFLPVITPPPKPGI